MKASLLLALTLAACSGGSGDHLSDAPTTNTTYMIGGTVSGVAGSGLVLATDGGDVLPISADGPFTMPTALPSGTAYSVTVATQPTGPDQTCIVTGGTGTVDTSDVTSIAVACATEGMLEPIDVMTTGLSTGSVMLSSGTDVLTITSNGTSTFPQHIPFGATYAVSISAQPAAAAHLACVLSGPVSGSATGPVELTLACTPTSGPALRVLLLGQNATSASTINDDDVTPDNAAAITVVVANAGTATLNLTLPVTISGVTGETLTVRDQPLAAVAAGEATTFTLVRVAPSAGSGQGTVTITSDDTASSPLSFTLATNVVSSSKVLYSLDGKHLFATDVTGGSTQLDPAYASPFLFGGNSYYHRGAHAVFQGTFTSPSNDIYFVGIPPNTAPVQNLTAAITGSSGYTTFPTFLRGNKMLFSAAPSTSMGYRIYSVDLSTDTATTPTPIDLPLPANAHGGGAPSLAPTGDRIVYDGDYETAGTDALWVESLPSGTPTKVNLPLTGTNPTFQAVTWATDGKHLVYLKRTQPCAAPQFDLYWVDLISLQTTQLNGTISTCLPPGAGVTPYSGTPYLISATGTRVFLRSYQGTSSPGKNELYVATNAGTTLSATVGVNGATVPGTQGVIDFAIDSTGTRVLFTADSGAGGAKDLYFTSMAGAVPTTTRVIQAVSPSTQGVTLFGAKTFVTDTRAIFALDDLVAGQSRLFTVDLSSAPTTFTPVVVAGSGAFPTGGTGLTPASTKALLMTTADGASVVFASDQGSSTANHLQLYSSPLVSPTPTVLGASGLDVIAVSRLQNQTVFFTQLAAGAAKPGTVWKNTIGHAGETQVSGAEITGNQVGVKLDAYGASRVFYFSQDQTAGAGVATLYTATTGTPTQLSAASGGSTPQISVKTTAD